MIAFGMSLVEDMGILLGILEDKWVLEKFNLKS
jgi:hypothetical protein